jgi:hypothetical protein
MGLTRTHMTQLTSTQCILNAIRHSQAIHFYSSEIPQQKHCQGRSCSCESITVLFVRGVIYTKLWQPPLVRQRVPLGAQLVW